MPVVFFLHKRNNVIISNIIILQKFFLQNIKFSKQIYFILNISKSLSLSSFEKSIIKLNLLYLFLIDI